jgi:hypothetical protein
MMPLFIGISHCLHDKFGGHDSSFRCHFQDSTTPVQPASNQKKTIKTTVFFAYKFVTRDIQISRGEYYPAIVIPQVANM